MASCTRKRFTATLLGCILAAGYSTNSGPAQSNPGGGSVENGAQFRQVPMATPAAPTTVYAPYVGPYAGYWSGQADIVTNMLAPQPGSLQKEQVRQAKVDTRRKQVDQFLYERDVMPTLEDDRERARIERVR